MHFSKLTLHGFKSFVDQTSLMIEPGMTGIVGPNGCGKSNLVEALRWVMGETSPKRMRGQDMDDVIFGGTATRPSRNNAEVELLLDNKDRSATAEFNQADDLHIARKIERDAGSEYRVNGKPVRQRDVQLIFADQATGAHANNIVGQGQIDALIRAKPSERRQILEEAAGTSGLHARRHEAELKLRAAEQNLTRVDDVLNQLDTQLRSLKTQIRQASRYKNLTEHIRKNEAILLHMKWRAAQQQLAETEATLQQAIGAVAELMSVVTQGTTARTEAAAVLPALRQSEAIAAAVLQKLFSERDRLDNEAERINLDISTQQTLRQQAATDHARETGLLDDATKAIEKLQQEAAALHDSHRQLANQLPTTQQAVEQLTTDLSEREQMVQEFTERVARTEAQRHSLTQENQQLEQRHLSLASRHTELQNQKAKLIDEANSRPDLELAKAMVDACETDLEKKQINTIHSEEQLHSAEQAAEAARAFLQDKQALLTRLEAEGEALRGLLQDTDHTDQVIDKIVVAAGLENALAAALGEALAAPLNTQAAMHWRELPHVMDVPPLPLGAVPLAHYVQAPAALGRTLDFIGLVETAEDGQAYCNDLKPGQILVSRDGWAWRWDGFTVTPQALTAAAMRLKQRNRLLALKQEIVEAEKETSAAQHAREEAETTSTQARTKAGDARLAAQTSFKALDDARRTYAKLSEANAATNSRLAAVEEAAAHASHDIALLDERIAQVQMELATVADCSAWRMQIATDREQIATLRGHLVQKQTALSRVTQQLTESEQRQAAIVHDMTDWQQRLARSSEQLDTLGTRIMETEANLQLLVQRPAELAAAQSQLRDEISTAEAKRTAAAETLVAAENQLTAIEQELKRNETALADARETRIRAEAAVDSSKALLASVRDRIAEKLDCTPETLLDVAQLTDEALAEAPALPQLEEQLAKHIREREHMGPVNMRADIEAQEIEAQLQKLLGEKDDLVNAIAKLRGGISQLNKEARERLQTAFAQVNEKFQDLFKLLFNGGRAHLELQDAEDPAESGLEIYACPPGKRLQVLTLLSGGERTLTALALLFAVFMTNPSPICVLDEAEAALDENNVDRFCRLIRTIADQTGTRFLIITHQRLTMAKVDRLYGVTMSEKGVSKLVSVNLAQAEEIRDKPNLEKQAA